MANDNHQTPDRIPLAQYLFTRLSSDLNIRHVHGVPGDYTLTALDFITPESTNLRWVGNATELCAAYAADGYARTKSATSFSSTPSNPAAAGALITSFGVGELSSLNALAGAYAERVPLVHVVGTPPRASQAARQCLHHTLGDGDHGVFARVYESVTVARAVLDDPATAAGEVDRVLRACVAEGRPVYLAVPTDMVGVMVEKPAGPLLVPGGGEEEGSEEERAVERVAEAVVATMRGAKRPLVLVDGFTARFGVRDEVNGLVAATGFATLTTPFGKSVVDEGQENFHGVYSGMAGEAEVRRWVEGCDLVLRFGPLDSDINTFGFTALPDPDVTVTFEKDSVRMGNKVAAQSGSSGGGQTVAIKPLLQRILKRLQSVQLPTTPDPFPMDHDTHRELLKPPSPGSHIDQLSFWPRFSSFLQPGDVVLTETGTASYGAHSLVLPRDVTLINSALWLSIGYALAAAQGAALAQRERMAESAAEESRGTARSGSGTLELATAETTVRESAQVGGEDAPGQQQRSSGRTILFTGDGSFQMTCQSLSDIIRNRLSVVVFVLNNDGYTVERLIHGADAAYNDVQPWRYSDAPWFFGAPRDDPAYPVSTWRVGTWGELEGVLGDERVRQGRGLHVVEVVMGVDDAPRSLVGFAEYVRRRNAGELGDGE